MWSVCLSSQSSQRILLATTPGVTYVAPNYGSQQSFRTHTNQFAIGVFDAAKNKLKVIPCSHVFKMEQHVAALENLEDASAGGEETYSTQQRVLADTFGSKKRQKQLQSRAANQVTVQESTSQVLTHAVSTITPNVDMEAEDTLLEKIRAQVLPAFDESAENVRDIYRTEAIMPAYIVEGMTSAAKRWRAVLKKGESAVSKDIKSATPLSSSLFVQNRLMALAKRGYDERDAATLKLLIFLHLLLQFRNGGRNKRKVVSEWTDEKEGADDNVKEYLLSTFTTSKKLGSGAEAVTRSVFDALSEQKLLCYISVTTLLLANFTLDADQVDAMATDLKMMTTDMLKYYAEAGCTVSKVRIHLSAPLKLPKLRKKLEKK